MDIRQPHRSCKPAQVEASSILENWNSLLETPHLRRERCYKLVVAAPMTPCSHFGCWPFAGWCQVTATLRVWLHLRNEVWITALENAAVLSIQLQTVEYLIRQHSTRPTYAPRIQIGNVIAPFFLFLSVVIFSLSLISMRLLWRSGCGQGPEDCFSRTDQQWQKLAGRKYTACSSSALGLR